MKYRILYTERKRNAPDTEAEKVDEIIEADSDEEAVQLYGSFKQEKEKGNATFGFIRNVCGMVRVVQEEVTVRVI